MADTPNEIEKALLGTVVPDDLQRLTRRGKQQIAVQSEITFLPSRTPADLQALQQAEIKPLEPFFTSGASRGSKVS